MGATAHAAPVSQSEHIEAWEYAGRIQDRRAVRRGIISGCLVGMLMVGCSSGSDQPFGVYSKSTGDEGFDAASLSGTLTLESGCLIVVDDGVESSLSFQEGVASWDSRDEVLTVDGREFSIGESVTATGGYGVDSNAKCAKFEQFRVAPDSFGAAEDSRTEAP